MGVAVERVTNRLVQTFGEEVQAEGLVDLGADLAEVNPVRVILELEHRFVRTHLRDVNADPGFHDRPQERERGTVELFGRSATIGVW